MRLRIHRSDGKTGHYSQDDGDRIGVLVKRLDPELVFCSGAIAIGVHNPVNVLNPNEICWIEVDTTLPTRKALPQDVDQVIRLPGREQYESLLAKRWPLWMKFRKGKKGDPLEALVELSLTSGEAVFLHIVGRVSRSNIVQEVFGARAICATFHPNGTIYINPKTITRARIYHSKDRISNDSGLWMVDADDI